MSDEIKEVDDAQSADSSTKKELSVEEINGIKGQVLRDFREKDLPNILQQERANWEKEQAKKAEEAKKLTPVQQKLQNLENYVKKIESEKLESERLARLATNRSKAHDILSEKNLKVPDSILNKLVSDGLENTESSVNSFVEMMEEYNKNITKNILSKNNTSVPGRTDIFDSSKTQMKRSEFDALPLHQQSKIMREGKTQLID